MQPVTRLGLIQVLCKNVSKSIVENKTNTSSRDSFQDPCLKIDGKTHRGTRELHLSPFKTIHPVLSRPWLCAHALRLLSRPQPKIHMRQEEEYRHKLTPFKTLGVDGIRVIREKDNANRVKDMVKNRGRETSFRTMGKSGRKKVSFQDMEHEVSKAPSFKTIDKSGTNRVSFKTIEETNNKSISFKTFDDWVKARTANCDTALKDALSFISEKKSAIDGEKDSHMSKTCTTREIQPQQYRAKQPVDRQPQ